MWPEQYGAEGLRHPNQQPPGLEARLCQRLVSCNHVGLVVFISQPWSVSCAPHVVNFQAQDSSGQHRSVGGQHVGQHLVDRVGS